MGHTNWAVVEEKSSPLHAEFSRQFLERHFSPTVVAALYGALPTYSQGPRRGLVKGYVRWDRCIRGGWRHFPSGKSGVQRPGTSNVHVVMDGKMLLDENANATDEGRIAAFLAVLDA